MADPLTLVQQIQLEPKFKKTDEDLINLTLEDAKETVDEAKLPKAVHDKALRLYTCHLLYIKWMVGNGNISQTMGPLSRTRYDWSKMNDPYMLEYNDLLDRYGRSRRRGAVFTRP